MSENEHSARLKNFIREHTSGGCKMLSMGDECRCPLCDVDALRGIADAWKEENTRHMREAENMATQVVAMQKLAGILQGLKTVLERERERFSDRKFAYVANQEFEAASVCRDAQDKMAAMLVTIGVIEAQPVSMWSAECPHCGWKCERSEDRAAVLDACRQHDGTCDKLRAVLLTPTQQTASEDRLAAEPR